LNLLLAVVVSYLIGSIPFGYVIARSKGVDIRQHGSGNIGATNVWRTLGPLPGIVAFAGDAGKGFAAVWLGRYAGIEGAELLTGFAAMAGHSWPVYLKFKGGKIIATGAGVVLALSPPATLIALLVWLSVLGIFRYVSLSSICAAVSVPVSLYALGNGWKYASFGTLLALLAIYKHIPNIKRLIAGNELKVGTKKEYK